MVSWKKSPDGWALAAAGVVLAGTLGWWVVARISAGSADGWTAEVAAGEVSVAPIATGGAAELVGAWPALPASDHADSWRFDVFTPPQIYFDPATGRFSVSPPESVELSEEPLQSPFGVSLLAVDRQPFRLQLVGYAGEVEAPWGIFANEVSGEGIVAQAGFRFADLGLALKQLEIKREDLIVPDSMPLREIVAVALVEDQREGKTVRLTSGYPAWTERPKATIRIESSGEHRVVEAGNRLELGEAVVEITGVFSGPDAVTAVKLQPDGTRETIRLTPDNSPMPQFEGDTIFETP